MNERMTFYLDDTAAKPETLMQLHKLLGTSLLELRKTIINNKPILDYELYTNEYYDTGGALLRQLVECIRENSLNCHIYYVHNDSNSEEIGVAGVLNDLKMSETISEQIKQEDERRFDESNGSFE